MIFPLYIYVYITFNEISTRVIKSYKYTFHLNSPSWKPWIWNSRRRKLWIQNIYIKGKRKLSFKRLW